jgi:hypothetical protein
MDRLGDLRDRRLEKMRALIEEMWARPAHTQKGDGQSSLVLLRCVMEGCWRDHDEVADWDVKLARDLLIEFVGGEPARPLRDQFA